MDTLRFRTIAGYTALVLATLTALYVLYRLNEVVLLFVFSIIVAAALRRGVLILEDRRVPRGLAILLNYILVIGISAAGIALLGQPLRTELQQAGETIPVLYDNQIAQAKATGSWQAAIAARLPTTATLFASINEGNNASTIGFQIVGLTTGVLNVVISLVAVLTLTFYWLIEQERFERLWLALLPVQSRAVARTTWREIETQLGAYVRSEAAQFVLTITLLWLGFSAVGLPNATILALYGGFAQLIPWVGIPLTLLPLVAMVFTGPLAPVILAAIIVIATGLLMDRVVEPWISGGAGAHPILVIIALLILADAAGLLGMIVALPIAATFQIVLSSVVRAASSEKNTAATQEVAQVREIRNRMQRLQEEMPADSPQRPAFEDLLRRLDGLVTRAETVIRERGATTAVQRARSRRQPLRVPSIFQRRS